MGSAGKGNDLVKFANQLGFTTLDQSKQAQTVAAGAMGVQNIAGQVEAGKQLVAKNTKEFTAGRTRQKSLIGAKSGRQGTILTSSAAPSIGIGNSLGSTGSGKTALGQ